MIWRGSLVSMATDAGMPIFLFPTCTIAVAAVDLSARVTANLKRRQQKHYSVVAITTELSTTTK
jgi:hypothetical protein